MSKEAIIPDERGRKPLSSTTAELYWGLRPENSVSQTHIYSKLQSDRPFSLRLRAINTVRPFPQCAFGTSRISGIISGLMTRPATFNEQHVQDQKS